MNPLTNMKNVKKLSEQELKFNFKTSWHDQYKNSAWIFIGGLPYDLTEGDVICVFSQYGEIVNINLVRDKASGKSRGFCFLCYEDQRSTILAVDNLNGIKLLGRIIRVDHVADYKTPKEGLNVTKETQKLYEEGCAVSFVPKIKTEPIDDYEDSGKRVKIENNIKIKKEENRSKIKKKENYIKIKKENIKKERKEKKHKRHKIVDKKHKRKQKRRSSSSETTTTISESSSTSSSSYSD